MFGDSISRQLAEPMVNRCVRASSQIAVPRTTDDFCRLFSPSLWRPHTGGVLGRQNFLAKPPVPPPLSMCAAVKEEIAQAVKLFLADPSASEPELVARLSAALGDDNLPGR